MSVMTAQPPLPITPEAPATLLGEAAALVEDDEGGRVFLHGHLVYAWAPGEDALRRWSAAQLARMRAAPVGQIAAAFGVDPTTVWRWGRTLTGDGVAGLASDKRGPKGPHRLTAPVLTRIHALAADGATQAAIAHEVGVSTTTVRRALGMPVPDAAATDADGPDADAAPVDAAAGGRCRSTGGWCRGGRDRSVGRGRGSGACGGGVAGVAVCGGVHRRAGLGPVRADRARVPGVRARGPGAVGRADARAACVGGDRAVGEVFLT